MLRRSKLTLATLWLYLSNIVDSRVLVPGQNQEPENETSWDTTPPGKSLIPRAGDPTNFAWVRKLVAIGDSYTAGIGSGNQIGQAFSNDWECSRYDYSYPFLIHRVLGDGVEDFKFLACSGDRSVQIYDQIPKMDSNTDMVIMTAGGNDLCLAAMIKKCIMLPYGGEDTCTAVIDKAQQNIDTILKPNLKQILLALKDKMSSNGIVVYNSYAQMFNTANDDCEKNQQWNILKWSPNYWFSTPLRLSIDRRKKFNKLVVQINDAIRAVVHDVSDEVGYTIGFSNWDDWPIDGVSGQMCDPSSKGDYPDPAQPDLQFFKPDTRVIRYARDELKRNDGFLLAGPPPFDQNGIDPSIYDSLLWKSANPNAEVKHKLDKRAPSPPDCPGDKDWIDPTLGLGLPDSFGKLFHPNEKGHETIASFAIEKAIQLRAKVIGAGSDVCELTDQFKCWKKEGRKGYASANKMNENIDDFCNSVQAGDGVGWHYDKTYFSGTPDEHWFHIGLSDNVRDWSKEECKDSFSRIVNGCDGNDPQNPLNWKSGGSYRRGEHTYEINIKRDNRPWPPIKSTYGKCHGQYYLVLSGYTIYGAGYSSWDYGQKTFLPCIKGCLGNGVTKWHFKYFDEPDSDGYEWKATFHTPIWTQARCFNNNKVAKCAEGGYTSGCHGTG